MSAAVWACLPLTADFSHHVSLAVAVVVGAVVFIGLKGGLITGDAGVVGWLAAQTPNPFACATLGGFASVLVSCFVSLATEPLPETHLAQVFGSGES